MSTGSEVRVTGWAPVTPFPVALSIETIKALNRTDSFRDRWIEMLRDVSTEEIQERRNRNLRRHAIETGIIERLYDVSWGVTEELVAEGLTLEVAEREGGVSPDVLRTITAQLDGLNLLVSYISENREFSASYIKSLHATITKTQATYDAIDTLGRPIQVPLKKGDWKTNENHVTRPDGSVLEYTPAIFVIDEIEALIAHYLEAIKNDVHPVALAAWLHHSFIRIHPFADGNGRVARALTLLVLLQGSYAPIVVRRDHREEYIVALDRANDGDLEVLIRFFARLEEYAITAELDAAPKFAGSTAVQVAAEWAKRLKARFEISDAEKRKGIETVSRALHTQLIESFERTREELQAQFEQIDPKCSLWSKNAHPPTEESSYWRAEIVASAREVDFFTNVQDGTWWVTLNVVLKNAGFRFGAVFQKVGHGESGVGALTFFSQTFLPRGQAVAFEETSDFQSQKLLKLTDQDSVRYLHNDDPADLWPRVEEGINRTLTAAISQFLEGLG